MTLRREAFGPKSLLFQAAPLKATPWTNSCEICMKRLKVVCLATADKMNRAARHCERELAQDQRRLDQRYHQIIPPQRNQHVADRESAAPDGVDHGVVGACGGVGRSNGRIGAEMPGQFE